MVLGRKAAGRVKRPALLPFAIAPLKGLVERAAGRRLGRHVL